MLKQAPFCGICLPLIPLSYELNLYLEFNKYVHLIDFSYKRACLHIGTGIFSLNLKCSFGFTKKVALSYWLYFCIWKKRGWNAF